MSTPAAPTINETLSWEERYRARTATLTILAGNLVLFGGVAAGLAFNGAPKAGVLDGIRAAADQPLSSGTGLLTPLLKFYDGRMVGLIIACVLQALGAAVTAAALGYLFRATKARRPEVPQAALYGSLVGPVLLGVSLLVIGIGKAVEVRDFVHKGDFSTKAAHDALGGGLLVAGPVLQYAAILAVALAFVFVCLNAMRVGLLTRFMGYLGMIVGALFILPLVTGFVVQGFWLIAFGFMLLGRWPNGRPPAWETGKAEPWPTQQQLREQPGGPRAKQPRGNAVAEPDDEPALVDEQPRTAAHSSSKKRKRKRR
jgi:hypothetical protein